MNEISTTFKATEKLSSWIRRQLQEAAQYVPRKGGVCKLCGRFCRTYKTDSETNVRYHRCEKCGINFKTSETPELYELMRISPEKVKKAVGNLPTDSDSEPVEQLDIDNETAKTPPAKTKPKSKRKR